MNTGKSLIIGFGEIGKALHALLVENLHQVVIRDVKDEPVIAGIGVMHICFPYTRKFEKAVMKYKRMYKPKYVIIHSTVPLGVSTRCNCFYSPVRGIHPHLKESLKTFVKYIAPKNRWLKTYFEKIGIKIKMIDSAESLEAMKLYCTTIYGLNIIAEKEVWDFCQKHNLDYNIVYTDCNASYNDGYKKMKLPHFTKYVLQHHSGKIGGHCVIPNCKLLKTPIAKFIVKRNNAI